MLCITQSKNMSSVINGLYKKMLLILLRATKQREKTPVVNYHPGLLQGS